MRSRRERLVGLLGLVLSLQSCSGEHDSGDIDTSTTTGTTSEAGTTTAATTGPTTGAVGDYPSLDERPCPEDSILTAENFGAPFMLTHCTGCHHVSLEQGERAGAPLGVDFETLAKVRAQAALIWARAGDQNATMPPVGPPSQEERARLGEWLACGAPTAADL